MTITRAQRDKLMAHLGKARGLATSTAAADEIDAAIAIIVEDWSAKKEMPSRADAEKAPSRPATSARLVEPPSVYRRGGRYVRSGLGGCTSPDAMASG